MRPDNVLIVHKRPRPRVLIGIVMAAVLFGTSACQPLTKAVAFESTAAANVAAALRPSAVAHDHPAGRPHAGAGLADAGDP
jgi:hypothetical protein